EPWSRQARQAPLSGDAPEGADAAVRRQEAVGQRSHPGQPGREAERRARNDRYARSGRRPDHRQQHHFGATPVTARARPRALIVVTGSELVRGDRSDLNGPFLAAQAVALGLEPSRITIVGDRPDELEAALREGLEADLCLISGG